MCLFKVWFPLDLCPGMGLLDHMGALWLVFCFFLFFNNYLSVLGPSCCIHLLQSSCGMQQSLLSECAILFIYFFICNYQRHAGTSVMHVGYFVVAWKLLLVTSGISFPDWGLKLAPELGAPSLETEPPVKYLFYFFFFLMKIHTVLYTDCTNLRSHKQFTSLHNRFNIYCL